jgi:hypothetical protein
VATLSTGATRNGSCRDSHASESCQLLFELPFDVPSSIWASRSCQSVLCCGVRAATITLGPLVAVFSDGPLPESVVLGGSQKSNRTSIQQSFSPKSQ